MNEPTTQAFTNSNNMAIYDFDMTFRYKFGCWWYFKYQNGANWMKRKKKCCVFSSELLQLIFGVQLAYFKVNMEIAGDSIVTKRMHASSSFIYFLEIFYFRRSTQLFCVYFFLGTKGVRTRLHCNMNEVWSVASNRPYLMHFVFVDSFPSECEHWIICCILLYFVE